MAGLDLGDYNTIFRYFHILSGITWIGLLYFFNFVNAPLLKIKLTQPYDVDMAERATGNITSRTLFFFRWGAMSTLVFGLLLVWAETRQWMTEGGQGGGSGYFLHNGWQGYSILVGILLALAMWFNVWFVIWPNQKVILRNNKKVAGGVADDEKKRLQDENAPRVKRAVMASRANTWMSIPMLFGMVWGAHGGSETGFYVALGVLAVFLLILVLYANRKMPAKA